MSAAASVDNPPAEPIASIDPVPSDRHPDDDDGVELKQKSSLTTASSKVVRHPVGDQWSDLEILAASAQGKIASARRSIEAPARWSTSPSAVIDWQSAASRKVALEEEASLPEAPLDAPEQIFDDHRGEPEMATTAPERNSEDPTTALPSTTSYVPGNVEDPEAQQQPPPRRDSDNSSRSLHESLSKTPKSEAGAPDGTVSPEGSTSEAPTIGASSLNAVAPGTSNDAPQETSIVNADEADLPSAAISFGDRELEDAEDERPQPVVEPEDIRSDDTALGGEGSHTARVTQPRNKATQPVANKGPEEASHKYHILKAVLRELDQGYGKR